jgi:hypothetical protein
MDVRITEKGIKITQKKERNRQREETNYVLVKRRQEKVGEEIWLRYYTVVSGKALHSDFSAPISH